MPFDNPDIDPVWPPGTVRIDGSAYVPYVLTYTDSVTDVIQVLLNPSKQRILFSSQNLLMIRTILW